MPTAAQNLKNLIDTEVTNKTDPESIGNIPVGNILKNLVDLREPLQFSTTVSREAYLLNPSAIPFQMADDKEDGNKYYISKDLSAWIQIGTSSNTPRTEIIPFTNQATINVSWNIGRKAMFGNAGMFVIETLDDDGKYRQKNVEVYPDDINNPTAYHIDLGGSLQSGRVIIK